MFHVGQKSQTILEENRATWRTHSVAPTLNRVGDIVKEGGIRVIIEDKLSGQLILEKFHQCSPEAKGRVVESTIEEIPSTPRPMQPHEMATKLNAQEDEIAKLKAQLAIPAEKRPSSKVLTTKLMEYKLAIPTGKRTTNLWKDEAQAAIDAYEKAQAEATTEEPEAVDPLAIPV
jgi:hypothetical protein